MTRINSGLFTALLLMFALVPAANAGGCATQEAFNFQGVVTMPTGAFVALTPAGTPASGPVEICNLGPGGTAGIGDIDDIDVTVGGFCFSRFGNCGGVGTLVQITSVDAASVNFDGDSFPSSGSFAVTAFSVTFNVSIPITFNLTDGTFSADGGALGTVAGTGMFIPPLAPPAILVTPNPAAFAATLINTTSSVDVTVSNAGTGESLVIGTIAAVNPLAAPFTITSDLCSGMTLAPAATCIVQLQFAPTATGAPTDSFDIPSNDPVIASVSVNVSGQVLAPAITVVPNPLVFASTEVGQTRTRVVTVTNSGSAPLSVGMLDTAALDAQFTVSADSCSGMTVAVGTTCMFSVVFAPESAATFMTSLNVPADDPNNASVTLNIEGTGVIGTSPAITVNKTALTFAEVVVGSAALTDTITVTSSGNEALVINAVSISGGDAADFTQVSTCVVSLDPDATCVITVTFNPLTGGTMKGATLTIDSNADLEPMVDISLSASAFSGSRIEVEPTSVDLGSTAEPIDVGASTTASVTVSNTGNEDLSVSAVTFAGEGADEFTSTGCTAAPVAAGSSCSVVITFAPLTEADKMVTMTIASNDAANAEVAVAANGFVFRGPRIAVPAGTVSITGSSSINVGQTATATATINSTGTEPLVINSIELGGTNADQFTFTETCTAAAVDPGSTCTISVVFNPTAPGTKTAQLSITSDDVTAFAGVVRGASAPAVINLTGTAVLPPPAAPPPRTDPPSFALQDEGATGATDLCLLLLGTGLLLARRRRK